MKDLKLKNTLYILRQYNQLAYEELLRKYPSKEVFLSGSEKYGSENNNNNNILCEIELSIFSLKESQKRALPNLEMLRDRLIRAKRLRLFSSITTAITSVGLIALIVKKDESLLTLVTALINLTSSLILLFANDLETPRTGGTTNLVDFFQKLNSLFTRAEKLEFKLTKIQATNSFDETTIVLLEEAEELSFELREIERLLWANRK
jgi:hypothetical protein